MCFLPSPHVRDPVLLSISVGGGGVWPLSGGESDQQPGLLPQLGPGAAPSAAPSGQHGGCGDQRERSQGTCIRKQNTIIIKQNSLRHINLTDLLPFQSS